MRRREELKVAAATREETPLGPGAGEAAAGEETPLGPGAVEAAPATPEPMGEMPWPAAGEKVAVGVEHLLHTLRIGETGVCEGPAPDDPLDVIVSLDTAAVLAPLRMPRSVLVPIGEKMRPFKFWDKCSEQTKRELLRQVGVRDPRDEVLPTTTSLALTLWGEYVPIGLRRPDEACKIHFVQPAFVKAFADGEEILTKAEDMVFDDLDDARVIEIEDQIQRQDMRQKLLTEWWLKNEVLLVCSVDEASGSVGLLAVRKNPMSVRYYEAAAQGRDVVARQSLLMLKQLEGLPDELPARCNCSLQATEDLIAHYIEGEMREARGETRGCLGFPQGRIKKVFANQNNALLCSHPQSRGHHGAMLFSY